MGALSRTETFSEVDTPCKSFLRGINMLVAEYDYDTDISLQRHKHDGLLRDIDIRRLDFKRIVEFIFFLRHDKGLHIE